MPRSLADGRIKFAILTTKPADPSNPLVSELAAGIDASCNVLTSDFNFAATDSERIAEKPLCVENNVNSIGASNYEAGFTVFRYFDETGAPDPTEDALFEALKLKGTEVWAYGRLTGKKSADAWEADDEIWLGAHLLTDTPRPPSETGGFIKMRVPCEVQAGYPFIAAVADA